MWHSQESEILTDGNDTVSASGSDSAGIGRPGAGHLSIAGST